MLVCFNVIVFYVFISSENILKMILFNKLNIQENYLYSYINNLNGFGYPEAVKIVPNQSALRYPSAMYPRHTFLRCTLVNLLAFNDTESIFKIVRQSDHFTYKI